MTRVLMVGIGATAPCYYRVLLPARELGWDYVGVDGDPPKLYYRTGLVDGDSKLPDWLSYDVVILQQPHGSAWLEFIQALRACETTVLYEIDDYLHGVQHVKGHAFRDAYTRDKLAGFEACMKACDGMIVSTQALANAYQPFMRRKPVWVCENGLDLGRYQLTPPARSTVNIGWAGATGHDDALIPWLQATAAVMRDHADVNFVSIGVPYATGFHEHFSEDRATAVPFCAIETYPCAMTLLDIALAPAGRGGFHRCKSDLRWLEAGALGIPTIADPFVYPAINDHVDGLHASTAAEAEAHMRTLVASSAFRWTLGENARRYVARERAIGVTASRWDRAVTDASRRAAAGSRAR